eukprot:GHVR01109250.1.p1 GENE.GHVR01109250.1~~GHVR01109250.1.p1  ORF type:complete len:100 (+),score=52.17 GHVR01109250.1:228-527(+)
MERNEEEKSTHTHTQTQIQANTSQINSKKSKTQNARTREVSFFTITANRSILNDITIPSGGNIINLLPVNNCYTHTHTHTHTHVETYVFVNLLLFQQYK